MKNTSGTPAGSSVSVINRTLPVLVSYGLVVLMQLCFSATIAQIGSSIFTAWENSYLVWIALVITVEVMITHRSTGEIGLFSSEWWAYRGAELVFNLVTIKIILYAAHGFEQLLSDISLWQQNFLQTFFTTEYTVAVIFGLFIWFIVSQYVQLLRQLEHDPDQLDLERTGYALRDRKAVRQQVMGLIFTLGSIMLVLTALLNVDFTEMRLQTAAIRPHVWLMLLYFVFGLALLAQTQFDFLRSYWYLNNIPVAPNLATRWAIYAGIVLIAFTLLASLLPTRYSVGFLTALGWAVTALVNLYMLLQLALLAPFIALLRALASFFGVSNIPPPQPILPTLPPESLSSPGAQAPVFELVKSLLFWLVFIGVIGFFLLHYIRQRQEWAKQLAEMPLAGWFNRFWRWMKAALGRVPADVTAMIQRPLDRLRHGRRSRSAGSTQRFGASPSTPREEVFHWYQQMLRENADADLPRKPAQTPKEYSTDLKQAAPIVSTDVDALTDEFIEARYSQHEVPGEAARRAHLHWKSLRAILNEHLRKK